MKDRIRDRGKSNDPRFAAYFAPCQFASRRSRGLRRAVQPADKSRMRAPRRDENRSTSEERREGGITDGQLPDLDRGLGVDILVAINPSADEERTGKERFRRAVEREPEGVGESCERGNVQVGDRRYPVR